MSIAPTDPAAKASVLIEALPYIRRWSGKTVVIKVGGEILESPEVLSAFATDLALMRFVGMNPVVVHGGGPQISDIMEKLGKQPAFVGGHRITDAETVGIVRMVLIGDINKLVVNAINAAGARAAGISGEDGMLFVARRITGAEGQDIGFVGEVDRVDSSLIEALLAGEFIPVIAPVGIAPDGPHNINADLAAGALAPALEAEKIVFLTNVRGLYRDHADRSGLISQITTGELKKLMSEGAVGAGMIPKMNSVLEAIEAGVHTAHILDGRVPHALLLEIFTDEGLGTMVRP
ncbi:MAG: acetylglutamate kinase [Actinomycetota bacterium]